MIITNTVTKLYFPGGVIDEDTIQTHFNEQNTAGYYLIAVDNMMGWYRFFWAHQEE